VTAPTTTVRLCRADELPPGSVRIFDVGDWSLAAARSGDAVFVVENRCSHDDGPLGEGRLVAGDREIECPRHGGRFDLATGAATRMPAASPIQRFPAKVVDGDVVVEVPAS
jgi:nitrite reductase/ring-hydroxylating ferredoxin subunit